LRSGIVAREGCSGGKWFIIVSRPVKNTSQLGTFPRSVLEGFDEVCLVVRYQLEILLATHHNGIAPAVSIESWVS